jgi:hypothetical protein
MDGRLTTVLADDADGIRTLSLIGDLDLSTSATVERQLRALCDAHARVWWPNGSTGPTNQVGAATCGLSTSTVTASASRSPDGARASDRRCAPPT